MRALSAILAVLCASPAYAELSRLETLFQESSRLVVEINGLDRDLQLHLTSFGRQGKSPRTAKADARGLRAKASAALQRWKAVPKKQWRAAGETRARELESMRRWLGEQRKTVLVARFKDREAFSEAAAACDRKTLTALLNKLCGAGCPRADLLAGYTAPCGYRSLKTALREGINRQRLIGGKHRAAIEDGELSLSAHGVEALREPLGRYWRSVYAALDAIEPEELEALFRYSALLEAKDPRRASGSGAVQRVLRLLRMRGKSEPKALKRAAAAAADAAYAQLKNEAAADEAHSSVSGVSSLPQARDAIRRVLRAGGSRRGVLNEDAERVLRAKVVPASGDWPARSLREAVRTHAGAGAEASVDESGKIVFADRRAPVRVVADPLNLSFRICRGGCGPSDFLAFDGTPVRAEKPAKKKKKKRKRRWWFGGTDSEDDAKPDADGAEKPLPPTRFLILELR
jgi:hypothetical protein